MASVRYARPISFQSFCLIQKFDPSFEKYEFPKRLPQKIFDDIPSKGVSNLSGHHSGQTSIKVYFLTFLIRLETFHRIFYKKEKA